MNPLNPTPTAIPFTPYADDSITCANCSSMESRRWYRNPDDPTTKICLACYEQFRGAKKAAIGTTCAIDSCKEQKSKRWYRNPDDSTTKICGTCYQSIYLAKKAEPPLPVGQQIFAPEEQLQPPELPAPANFPSLG